jgi:hypothetical protein
MSKPKHTSIIRSRVALDIKATPRHVRSGEGAFVTLTSGRIVLAYSRVGAKASDHDVAVIASRFSDDGGRPWWTRDRVLVPYPTKTNAMS